MKLQQQQTKVRSLIQESIVLLKEIQVEAIMNKIHMQKVNQKLRKIL
jgi:hypothetical protein